MFFFLTLFSAFDLYKPPQTLSLSPGGLSRTYVPLHKQLSCTGVQTAAACTCTSKHLWGSARILYVAALCLPNSEFVCWEQLLIFGCYVFNNSCMYLLRFVWIATVVLWYTFKLTMPVHICRPVPLRKCYVCVHVLWEQVFIFVLLWTSAQIDVHYYP